MNNNLVYANRHEKTWFFFVLIYLSVDLARIQDISFLSSFRPGMIVTIILFLYLVKYGRITTHITRQIAFVIVFFLLVVLFVPVARNNYYAFQAAKSLILMIPFVFSVVSLINTQKKLNGLFWGFVLIAAYNAAYGLLHHGRGPGGTVADENDLALFLVTFLPFTFYLLSQNPTKIKKAILLLCVLLSALAIVATFSRGGFVGLVVMGGVLWWYSRNKMKIAIVALVLGGVLFFFGGLGYEHEVSSITNLHEKTAYSRILSWDAATRMFLDHPLGVGGGNFIIYFDKYQPAGFAHSMWGRAAHSLWFTLIPETGIFGILLYFLIIKLDLQDLFALRRLSSRGRDDDPTESFFPLLSTTLLASLAGFFAAATFLSVLYYPLFWYLTAIIVAARNIGLKYGVKEASGKMKQRMRA